MRLSQAALLLSFGFSVSAADFKTGQAARAVIGQPSFSAHDAGITPVALTLGNGKLYVGDLSRRVLGFDLAQVPGVKDELAERAGTACRVCLAAPASSVSQSVSLSSSSSSQFGKVAVQADTANRRVLIWRDVSAPRSLQGPDIVLGRGSTDTLLPEASFGEPVSVAYDGRRLFVGDAAFHRILVWNSLPSADNQPADAVLGQPNFNSTSLGDVLGPDTLSRPSALVSDGTNLYVADMAEHRVLLFSASDLELASSALVNSASLIAGPVAPGALVSVEAAGLTEKEVPVPEDAARLPRKLGGVAVYLNGVPLPLFAVSDSQVRAQVPYSFGTISSASLMIRSERADGTIEVSNAIGVKIAPAAPGIFAFGGKEPRGAMALRSARGLAGTPVTSDYPARPGDVLTVWAAGLGAVASEDNFSAELAGEALEGSDASVVRPVTASVGGEPVEVLSATLPHGSIGVYEVRIQLPSHSVFDSAMPLQISQDGTSSNTVMFPARTATH